MRGHEVRCVSRPLLSSGDLKLALAGCQAFVHLAARAHVLRERSADPQAEFAEANVQLTQSAATAALQAKVPRFIFLSSAGVLGATSPPEGFTDASPPRPHDPYSASKLAAEQWLGTALGPSLELAILRPPLIYGAGARGNLMRLLQLALRGWPLPLGALRAPRSLLAVRNLTDIIIRLACGPGGIRGTMLVADRETTSVAELFSAVAEYAGHRPWLAPLPPALIRFLLVITGRGSDVDRLTGPFVLHPQVAQSRFNWIPPYSLRSELHRTVLAELERRCGPRAS